MEPITQVIIYIKMQVAEQVTGGQCPRIAGLAASLACFTWVARRMAAGSTTAWSATLAGCVP